MVSAAESQTLTNLCEKRTEQLKELRESLLDKKALAAESISPSAADSSSLLYAFCSFLQAEVDCLVTHVARGEEKEAKAILEKKPLLLLGKGCAVEHCGREFNGITAFQFACWALDWHMCEMLRAYLPKEAQAAQLKELKTQSTHGVSAERFIRVLITALGKCKSNLKLDEKWVKSWIYEVGSAQYDLPANVAQMHRSPTYPPSFDQASLFRQHKTEKLTPDTYASSRLEAGTSSGSDQSPFLLSSSCLSSSTSSIQLPFFSSSKRPSISGANGEFGGDNTNCWHTKRATLDNRANFAYFRLDGVFTPLNVFRIWNMYSHSEHPGESTKFVSLLDAVKDNAVWLTSFCEKRTEQLKELRESLGLSSFSP